jgi:ribosomal protein S18 acetylase RimI-like enzyme
VGDSAVVFRDAVRDDLASVVGLIHADSLSRDLEAGADEGGPLRAFEAIEADAHNRLIVAERDGAVIGTMQLTLIPSLTLRGGRILQIENVRVESSLRSGGIGRQMIEWAIEQGREAGCALVQLSSNNERTRAHEFYRRLGFAQSHTGFKLRI